MLGHKANLIHSAKQKMYRKYSQTTQNKTRNWSPKIQINNDEKHVEIKIKQNYFTK